MAPPSSFEKKKNQDDWLLDTVEELYVDREEFFGFLEMILRWLSQFPCSTVFQLEWLILGCRGLWWR
jgi:hypothetical protein